MLGLGIAAASYLRFLRKRLAQWLLASGSWSDAGVWQDTEVWHG